MPDVRYSSYILYGCGRVVERKILASEGWQFMMIVLGFFVVALFWPFVVYLPGRTMERWGDQRPGRGDGKTAPPVDPGTSDGPSKPGS
jgi:hypothetical protein